MSTLYIGLNHIKVITQKCLIPANRIHKLTLEIQRHEGSIEAIRKENNIETNDLKLKEQHLQAENRSLKEQVSVLKDQSVRSSENNGS